MGVGAEGVTFPAAQIVEAKKSLVMEVLTVKAELEGIGPS